MKRRLLSLLLVMAMLLSMVPFQAFAEEVDEAPALLEETEEIVSEIPEDTVPEITVETVPETTEETVPETTEETVPETTEETVPVVLEEDPALPEEEEVPLLLEEPEQAEAPVEAEVPAEGAEGEPDLIVEMRAKQTLDLAKINNEAFAGYTFEVDEVVFKDFATIENGSTLVPVEGIQIPENGYVTVPVIATPAEEGGTPVTVAVHIYADIFNIGFYVNDDFSVAYAEYTLNYYEQKSFTLAVKANDGGPLGNVKWTQPSTKLLKRSIDKDTGALTYTSTGKTGTATITVASLDNPNVANTLTVNVVKQVVDINIKLPSSARTVTETGDGYMMKGVIMTAGQKLSLSTDIPKTAADKAVTWEIIDSNNIKPTVLSESEAPEGATASGQNWDAYASIDSKGVLRTKAGVTMETVQVGVRVRLTSTAKDENPVEDYLLVYIQPPVETLELLAIPLSYIDDINSSIQESMESGSNSRYPEAERYPIDLGPMLLIPVGRYQNDVYPDVSWKFSGSKKVAEFMTADKYFGDSLPEEELTMLRAMNARVMIPKAPGKVSIAATSKDGSGAKFSGALNLFGPSFAYASMSAPKNFDSSQPLHPGDRVQFTSEAYYYKGAPATGVQRKWQVYCADDGNANDFATIDQKGKLTITDRVSKPARLTIVCVLYNKEGAYTRAVYSVYVEPVNDNTLGMVVVNGGLLNTVDSYTYEPGKEMTLLPVWVNNSVRDVDHVAAEDVSYKVSGKACAFDKATGVLTFKNPGTTRITVTATLDGKKQSATYTFRCEYFTRKTEILDKPESGVITVVGGKSLSLKAINWSDEAKTKKATDQSIFWRLDGPYADINWKTGKLTTEKVTAAVDINVEAHCRGIYATNKTPSDSITIRIIPEKTQYRSYADFIYQENETFGDGNYLYLTGQERILNGYDVFSFDAYSYGLRIPTQITKLTSSKPEIVEIVKNTYGEPINIRIPANAKPGKVTITINGTMTVGKDEQNHPIYQDAPSAKVTINVVNPVTSIKISRPKDKADNDLPLYVGKSLTLSSTINKDATNKKLVWHVGYSQFDERLDYLDKTTIKNGVLKVDKSTLTASRYYYVWATSEDGYSKSNVLEIRAYAMTGSIKIASIGDWPNGNYADYLNNRTVTIQQSEEVQFGALVSDVNGYYEGANQDVTWTISGNKGGIIASEEGKEYITDVLNVTGLKPGTVTVKATAKDGSKKTATFKLVVEPNVLSAPYGVPETVSDVGNPLPRLAYNYKPGEEIVWMNANDISWTCSDTSIKPYIYKNAVWYFDVPETVAYGTELTFTATDERPDIPEAQRAAPFSFTTTYIEYVYKE